MALWFASSPLLFSFAWGAFIMRGCGAGCAKRAKTEGRDEGDERKWAYALRELKGVDPFAGEPEMLSDVRRVNIVLC